MQNGKVRFCHGDIHSGNIFVADQIYIFDAIEFNDRMRFSDVAADIGFLAMDLEFKNKPELAKLLVDKYIEYSKDLKIGEVLAFYKCYRAYVRGKVISFKLNDSIFKSHPKGNMFDHFITQAHSIFTGSKEGGLFIMIGKKK